MRKTVFALALLGATTSLAFAQAPASRNDAVPDVRAATAASFTGTYTGTFASPWAGNSGAPLGARLVLSPDSRDKLQAQFSILGKPSAQGPCRGTGALKADVLEIRVHSANGCDGRVLSLQAAPGGLNGTMEAAGAENVAITFRKLRPSLVQ